MEIKPTWVQRVTRVKKPYESIFTKIFMVVATVAAAEAAAAPAAPRSVSECKIYFGSIKFDSITSVSFEKF